MGRYRQEDFSLKLLSHCGFKKTVKIHTLKKTQLTLAPFCTPALKKDNLWVISV